MSTIEQVTPLIEKAIKELGFELFDIRFFRAGSCSVLRVIIDSPDGVKIADCANVSNVLSDLLDTENFSSERPYNLEVSSPGIDRPLKTEKDYKRVTGRDVRLHLTVGVVGKKTITGEVISCQDNTLKVKIENKIVEIPLSDIYSGKEEIRFK